MSTIYSNFRTFLLVSLIISAACSGTQNTTTSNREDPTLEAVDTGYDMRLARETNQSNIKVEPNKDRLANISLNEMIVRLPGVRIQSGRDANAKFIIDGASGSFISDTSPLFVVNGNAIGIDYSLVYSMVNPNDVVTVSVLKGSDATIYGTRGSNGVILIRTANVR